ncbi:MAG: photosystem II S4 domain protein [Spirulina sp. SIO3F2]|nr:photosystem II S4 domain protein [Spirulina sp. SIO3F2]
MLPKADLLKGVEHRDELTRILDQAEQAIRTWEVVVTDFWSPPVLIEAQTKLAPLNDIQVVAWGGYPQAERQRLALARTELPLETEQVELAALDVAGNFLFDAANHRDFLGAILNTGVVRDKVGDILVLGDRGAQILVVPELVEFFQQSLLQVRSVPVKVQPIELSELKIRPPKRKEITTVEASLRLDAIASAGFGMSRSKMVAAIQTGDVRVNWQPVKQPSQAIAAGDLIAMRGKGRVEVGDIMITKKERYRVNLTRLL